MIQNTLFVTQKTPFVNQITKKKLYFTAFMAKCGEMWSPETCIGQMTDQLKALED